MALSLREITRSNFNDCVKLRVREDQKYVASNVYSIAQSKIEPECIPMAIYNDETMVGFLMFVFDYPEKELYLIRFMIDQQYQHMGYGRGALQLLKEMGMADPGIQKITLSTNPDNAYGIKVYEKFGFVDTGILDDGEEVFMLDLKKQQNG